MESLQPSNGFFWFSEKIELADDFQGFLQSGGLARVASGASQCCKFIPKLALIPQAFSQIGGEGEPD